MSRGVGSVRRRGFAEGAEPVRSSGGNGLGGVRRATAGVRSVSTSGCGSSPERAGRWGPGERQPAPRRPSTSRAAARWATPPQPRSRPTARSSGAGPLLPGPDRPGGRPDRAGPEAQFRPPARLAPLAVRMRPGASPVRPRRPSPPARSTRGPRYTRGAPSTRGPASTRGPRSGRGPPSDRRPPSGPVPRSVPGSRCRRGPPAVRPARVPPVGPLVRPVAEVGQRRDERSSPGPVRWRPSPPTPRPVEPSRPRPLALPTVEPERPWPPEPFRPVEPRRGSPPPPLRPAELRRAPPPEAPPSTRRPGRSSSADRRRRSPPGAPFRTPPAAGRPVATGRRLPPPVAPRLALGHRRRPVDRRARCRRCSSRAAPSLGALGAAGAGTPAAGAHAAGAPATGGPARAARTRTARTGPAGAAVFVLRRARHRPRPLSGGDRADAAIPTIPATLPAGRTAPGRRGWAVNGRQNRRRAPRGARRSHRNPAASYSPRANPPKYHRRWWA